jgi:hypothetical protein
MQQNDTQITVANKEGIMFTPTDLIVQFSDDFNKEYPAPDYLNITHWTKWQGTVSTAQGQCTFATTPAGAFGLAGIATRQKQFNPDLKGTNGVEVTLVDYTQQGPPPKFDPEIASQLGIGHTIEPLGPHFITGVALTIGDQHGQIGCEPLESRSVQLHFDMISNWGLEWWLVRSLVPEDFDKYPKWDLKMPSFKTFLNKGPFISEPCLGLAAHHYDPIEITESPFGHRLGLYLTDDGNTLLWTFDGKVKDSVDITGFFASSPTSLQDGAHLTVSGVGICSWTIDDVAIYVSP